MTITEATALIQPGFKTMKSAETWADLGCGAGTFTEAVCQLLGAGSNVFAVDREEILNIPASAQNIAVTFIKRDFVTDMLPFTDLDGIILANALHFVDDKVSFIEKMLKYIKSTGRIIVVEYDNDKPNAWIPYPIRFSKLVEFFAAAGLTSIEKIGERDSIYNGAKMYAACILR